LTLALLFLMLVALLAALATLSGIKKSLSEGPRAATPESAYTPPASTYSEPQTAYSGSYSGGYGAEPVAEPVAQPAAQEVATGYVPLSQATEPEPVPEPAPQPVATTTAASSTDPEEQPFERDGRWWFKRGDELLVYDEGTGQWVAGQQQPAPGAAPADTTTDTTSFPAPTGEAGEGWRCASCGAINGSTATVCRMCFTPR
jgi:hypothetical protein